MHAAAGEVGKTELLPIFPLSLVAVPGADVPLQIYEARYRVLFNTLLGGAESVDEVLVDQESAWCGTRLYGMNLVSGVGGLAKVGTSLRIQEFDRLADGASLQPRRELCVCLTPGRRTANTGRLYVTSRGEQRYRILSVVKEKPVLVCEVEWFCDEPDAPGEDDLPLPELADDVRTLFINTLKLSNKQKGDARETELPMELDSLDHTALSFWLLRIFAAHPAEQQRILDMTSCRARLLASQAVLRCVLNACS